MGAKPPKISEIPDKFVLNLASLEYKIEIKSEVNFLISVVNSSQTILLKVKPRFPDMQSEVNLSILYLTVLKNLYFFNSSKDFEIQESFRE